MAEERINTRTLITSVRRRRGRTATSLTNRCDELSTSSLQLTKGTWHTCFLYLNSSWVLKRMMPEGGKEVPTQSRQGGCATGFLHQPDAGRYEKLRKKRATRLPLERPCDYHLTGRGITCTKRRDLDHRILYKIPNARDFATENWERRDTRAGGGARAPDIPPPPPPVTLGAWAGAGNAREPGAGRRLQLGRAASQLLVPKSPKR